MAKQTSSVKGSGKTLITSGKTTNLAGYGTTKVVGDRVNLIAGWSEKVLDYISQVEEGGQTLVKAIEEYQI